jgi:hypothetical protein
MIYSSKQILNLLESEMYVAFVSISFLNIDFPRQIPSLIFALIDKTLVDFHLLW